MDNKQFFDRLAYRVLNECKTKEDFVDTSLELEKYVSMHEVKERDMDYFTESGAAEVLAMASGSYKRVMK